MIDEGRIHDVMARAKTLASSDVLNEILSRARELKGLDENDVAILSHVEDDNFLTQIFETARWVKERIYGWRLVLFAPLYISNLCSNECLYCAFRAHNKTVKRRALTQTEIARETTILVEQGHKRVLLVAGESYPKEGLQYILDAIGTVYATKKGRGEIRRLNVNIAPLSVEEFRELKRAEIGTYQLFQETYHDETYRNVHRGGPKADPDYRIEAIDRAFEGGINDVGIGVLYGLYDYRFEVLATLQHIEHLENTFNVGPHTISVPRIQQAEGSEFSKAAPYPVSDADFKKLVAVLRLAVPYTGIILSTRETAELRDELFRYGISQVSAESSTSPGGYSHGEKNSQFCLHDERRLDDVIHSLIEKKYIPSFCAACYRRERTGEAFMELAKPGAIKHMCDVNALATLKEYLVDFASPEVKKEGYGLIREAEERLDAPSKRQLEKMFHNIDRGIRDEYV